MSANQLLLLNSQSIEQRIGTYAVPKILANAEPWLVLEKFGAVRTPLPKKKGENIAWRRVVPYDVTTTTAVEGVLPPPQNFQMEIVTDTIDQFVQWSQFSDKVVDLHEDPVAEYIVDEQRKQIQATRELVSWDALRNGSQVIYSGTATSRGTVNTPIDIDQVKAAVALLKDNHGKKVTSRINASDGFSTEPVNSAYVAVGPQRLEKDVQDLEGFVPVERYGSYKFIDDMHEVGKTDQCRFVLTPDLPPFYDSGASISGLNILSRSGSLADVFPLVVLAQDAWGITELAGKNALDVTLKNPEMNHATPTGQWGFASWKMYFCATRLNEAWIVRIESAATE